MLTSGTQSVHPQAAAFRPPPLHGLVRGDETSVRFDDQFYMPGAPSLAYSARIYRTEWPAFCLSELDTVRQQGGLQDHAK